MPKRLFSGWQQTQSGVSCALLSFECIINVAPVGSSLTTTAEDRLIDSQSPGALLTHNLL